MYYKNSRKGVNKRDFAKIRSFSSEEANLFEDFLLYLKQKKDAEKDSIPISILSNRVLAPLEIVVKYLRENLDYSYKEIGELLNRNAGPMGVSYRNAKRKLPSKFHIFATEIMIPLSIFKNSNLTVFETIVVYLKDSLHLRFTKIANLLGRNYRTVWTVYNRAKIKNER